MLFRSSEHRFGSDLGSQFGLLEPYDAVEEFLADLRTVHASLCANGGRPLADGRLADLIRAASVFRFYLMPLDLRQHAQKHIDVVAGLFAAAGLEDFAALNEAERERVLLRELSSPRPLYSPFAQYSEDTEHELAIFRAAAEIKAQFGEEAIRQSIISNAENVSEILALALIMKETGLLRLNAEGLPESRLNIVPLFETIEALQECIGVMDHLFSLPWYRHLLAGRSNIQEIMLGYHA